MNHADAAVPLVLVVDDSPVERLLAVTLITSQLGWRVAEAASAQEALERVAAEEPLLILTDLLMPEMDGLELIEAVHQRLPHLPFVLMTAQGSEAVAMQALKRGAASYVPKKDLAVNLSETLEQVVAAAQKHRQQRRLHQCVLRLEIHWLLDNDRTMIPALVSTVQEHLSSFQLCDEAARIRVGVALEEALLNAMYHGNLEVSSELRQQGDEVFYREADHRRQQPPYSGRRVRFAVTLTPAEAVFTVCDQGPGFNPASLPDPTDPANLDRVSGRGLLLIHTFMDEVKFNDAGNQITMTKRRRT